MTSQRTVTILAPAKINLGLEILEKRDDGYHEILTVMAMIDLADTLTILEERPAAGVHITGMPDVPTSENLIAKAIHAFAAETGARTDHTVVVEKRIPSPGGLGGASSDAASTLLALDALHKTGLPEEKLAQLGSWLGADVPFFLGSPLATARGTGTTLSPLPPLEGWVVLAIPKVDIQAKTATLYGALRPDDFTDGSMVETIAETIHRGDIPETGSLTNAFERPLYELAPAIGDFRQQILDAGAPAAALSGAGPAHYVLNRTEQEARMLAGRLANMLSPDAIVTVSRVLAHRPTMRVFER